MRHWHSCQRWMRKQRDCPLAASPAHKGTFPEIHDVPLDFGIGPATLPSPNYSPPAVTEAEAEANALEAWEQYQWWHSRFRDSPGGGSEETYQRWQREGTENLDRFQEVAGWTSDNPADALSPYIGDISNLWELAQIPQPVPSQIPARVRATSSLALAPNELSMALNRTTGLTKAQANALAPNQAMSLMEQTLIEQFTAGRLLPTVGTEKATQWTIDQAEVESLMKQQTGRAGGPDVGGIMKKYEKNIPLDSGIMRGVDVGPYMVGALMDLAFGGIRRVTPSASTVIRQAEDVVRGVPRRQVTDAVKTFGGFVGDLIP